jgi:di/tricarboxylate transporter
MPFPKRGSEKEEIPMNFDAWLTIAAVVTALGLLAFTRTSPDLILLAALTGLFTLGVLGAEDMLSGFTNQGVAAVAALYVVAAGVKRTGGMMLLASRLLGKPLSILAAQLRTMIPVTFLSAFLNNTPVVAMLVPTVSDWAKRHGVAASKLMIPLSYAAILGGMCTLIGTSTNLILNGLLIAHADKSGLTAYRDGLGMFEIAALGLPCAVVGTAYMLLIGRRLLPDRQPFINQISDPREYTVEMLVEPGSQLAGKTIEEAGLRRLNGVYLMDIERADELLVAVGPEEHLHAGDRLVFVGVVDSVVDLQKISGLAPATNQVFKLSAPRSNRCLIEAVVSDSCPLVGKTVRDGRFRTVYNAVIIALARNGQRVSKKIGDIVLRAGDTLLLEAQPSFVQQRSNSRDFFLVSRIEDSTPPSFEKSWLALLILTGMVVAASFRWTSMLNAAMIAAGLMIITRCCPWRVARSSIDWQVLLAIVAAFGIGQALHISGAAGTIAGNLIALAGDSPWLALALVYAVTMLFTELITNNAAVVLVFPIAIAAAGQLDVSIKPFIMTIMIAGSASFATPIGYQTNLMVYGPGSYRFSDYLRTGIPLDLILWGLTVAIAPRIWPF